PPVALRAHAPPVVDVLAPQLPFRMGDVGRSPGDVAVLEEVGMGADVGAARSSRQAAKADADVYGDPNASGGPSGRICHQLWPASASQSTKSYASDPRRPLGSDVGCSSTPLERAARNTSPVLTELTVVAKGDEDEG